MMGQKHTQICIAKVKLHQIIEVGITSTFAPPEWSELTEALRQAFDKDLEFRHSAFPDYQQGVPKVSARVFIYAIGGSWHWFHPFRYRELLYNQFLSFLTFCCFLWVKNSIYHLGASQNIWLSEFHKFSKKCCCKRSVRKNRFGCTKYSRGVWAISKYSFLR